MSNRERSRMYLSLALLTLAIHLNGLVIFGDRKFYVVFKCLEINLVTASAINFLYRDVEPKD